MLMPSACRAGDGDTANGDVPASVMAAQIQVLNTAYASLGISFVVAGVDKYTNDSVRWLAESLSSSVMDHLAMCDAWYAALPGSLTCSDARGTPTAAHPARACVPS